MIGKVTLLLLEAILLSGIFALAFAERNYWQFRRCNLINTPVASTESKNEHTAQAFVQSVVAVFAARAYGWPTGLVLLAVFWLVFDLWYNVRRDTPILYVGKDAWLDRSVRYVFPKSYEIAMLIIKVAAITASIILYYYYA